MLILGLFTRIPAAMLALTMLVAIKSAKWGDVDSLETLLGFEEDDLFRRLHVARDRRPRRRLAGPAAGECGRARRRIDLRIGLAAVSQSRDIAAKPEPGFAPRA